MSLGFPSVLTTAAVIATGAPASVAVAHPGDNAQPLELVSVLAPFGDDGSVRYTDIGHAADVVCLSSDLAGTAIISVFSLSQPFVVSVYRPDLHVAGVSMQGRTVALAAPDVGQIHVVDLSTPGEPAVIAIIQTGDWSPGGVAIAGDDLWATSRTSPTMRRYGLADPDEPVLIDEVVTPDRAGLGVPTVTPSGVLLPGLAGESESDPGATYVLDPSVDPLVPVVLRTGVATGSVAVDARGRLFSGEGRVGGEVTLWSSASAPLSSIVAVDASSYGLNTIGPGRVATAASLGFVAWHQAGLHVFDLDRVDPFGDLLRLGYYGTSDASPLDGFVGANAVVPIEGTRRVIACDSRYGLHVLDLDRVLPAICPCEFDVIDGVDRLDLLTFVSVYVRGSLLADVDRDLTLSVRDLLAFLKCWFAPDDAGCL